MPASHPVSLEHEKSACFQALFSILLLCSLLRAPPPAQPAQGRQNRCQDSIQGIAKLKVVQIYSKELHQMPIAERWEHIEQLVGQILRRLYIQAQPCLPHHKHDGPGQCGFRVSADSSIVAPPLSSPYRISSPSMMSTA